MELTSLHVLYARKLSMWLSRVMGLSHERVSVLPMRYRCSCEEMGVGETNGIDVDEIRPEKNR